MHKPQEREEFERTLISLSSPQPLESLDELEQAVVMHPRYAGPEPWYALIESAAAEKNGEQRSGNRGRHARRRSSSHSRK